MVILAAILMADESPRSRLIWIIVGGLILEALNVLGAFAIYEWTKASPPPPSTISRYVVPPDAALGGSVYIRLMTDHGHCYKNFSAADPDRRDAHQCKDRIGRTLDPCFAAPRIGGPGAFVCLTSPWDTTRRGGRLMYLADGVFSSSWLTGRTVRPGPDRPWALQLTNGARCLLSPLPPSDFPAQTKYVCAWKDGSLAGYTLDFPNEQLPGWTVSFVTVGATTGGSAPTRVTETWK
jgi:hypothetical protein